MVPTNLFRGFDCAAVSFGQALQNAAQGCAPRRERCTARNENRRRVTKLHTHSSSVQDRIIPIGFAQLLAEDVLVLVLECEEFAERR